MESIPFGSPSETGDGAVTYPQEYVNKDFGPFGANLDTPGQVLLGSETNQVLPYFLDREMEVLLATCICTVVAADQLIIRLGWVNNGQTTAAADIAGQYITLEKDLSESTVANTMFKLTIDPTKVIVPAGARLFIHTSAHAELDMEGLIIHVRLKSTT